MRKVWRAVIWGGIATIVGPGSSIPNDFDMIFLVSGVFLMSLGVVGLLISSKQTEMVAESDDGSGDPS